MLFSKVKTSDIEISNRQHAFLGALEKTQEITGSRGSSPRKTWLIDSVNISRRSVKISAVTTYPFRQILEKFVKNLKISGNFAIIVCLLSENGPPN